MLQLTTYVKVIDGRYVQRIVNNQENIKYFHTVFSDFIKHLRITPKNSNIIRKLKKSYHNLGIYLNLIFQKKLKIFKKLTVRVIQKDKDKTKRRHLQLIPNFQRYFILLPNFISLKYNFTITKHLNLIIWIQNQFN